MSRKFRSRIKDVTVRGHVDIPSRHFPVETTVRYNPPKGVKKEKKKKVIIDRKLLQPKGQGDKRGEYMDAIVEEIAETRDIPVCIASYSCMHMFSQQMGGVSVFYVHDERAALHTELIIVYIITTAPHTAPGRGFYRYVPNMYLYCLLPIAYCLCIAHHRPVFPWSDSIQPM
jgi:hypothetical protein